MDIPTTVSQTVGQLLDELATRFGATAEHLYGVLVRQAVIHGWVTIVSAVAFLALAVLGVLAFRWGIRTGQASDWDGSDMLPYFAVIIGAVAAIIGGILAVAGFIDGAARLANPEFWVFDYLSKLLGG